MALPYAQRDARHAALRRYARYATRAFSIWRVMALMPAALALMRAQQRRAAIHADAHAYADFRFHAAPPRCR